MGKRYNPQDVAESVRQCAEADCYTCQMADDRIACLKKQLKAAADTIENLAAENQRMRNATSRIVERGIAELVRLAGEANTAVERGLYGVSDELVSRMQEHMTELSELGRETMIHMQPLGETGTLVDLVKVGGEVVYRREGFGDEEPGV